MSRAASTHAIPVLNVTPLPPAPELYPIESVVPIAGLTSAVSNPKISATCMAIATRLPPTSGDPSSKLRVPSALTLITELAGPPPLNQAPEAIPLPLFGPSSGEEI